MEAWLQQADSLPRPQFAFTISFHIIFPAFTIGLSGFIATLEVLWAKTGREAAAFAQGVVLGAVLRGIEIADGEFAAGAFDWLTPFSLFTGVALVVGYALTGATWLVLKTDGELASTDARYPGSSGRAGIAGIHVDRHRAAAADRARLHRFHLLGLPRQGPHNFRLSLRQRSKAG